MVDIWGRISSRGGGGASEQEFWFEGPVLCADEGGREEGNEGGREERKGGDVNDT